MPEGTPTINLADAPMKPGGNGGKFVHNSCRLGPKIVLLTSLSTRTPTKSRLSRAHFQRPYGM